ncbi:MAG: biotin/lipoyl-binding protein, partial [Rhizobiales bacterium]|nr:biotin/lipoyl-binding protein [Hyphomicrobiales bacterium]
MRRSVVLGLAVVVVLGFGVAYKQGLLPAWVDGQVASSGPPASGRGGGTGKAGARNMVPSVTVATAETGNLPVRRSTIGWINSVSSTTVTTQQQGVVTTIAVANGADVKAGDLLVQLDDRAAKATLARDKAALARDQATVVSTKADLKRAQDLVARQ